MLFRSIRTNVVFSRIALLSCFCAETQSFGKIPEKFHKSYFDGGLTEPEDEAETGPTGPTHHHGAPGVGPRPGGVWLPRAAPRDALSTTYCLRPKTHGHQTCFPETLLSSAATENPNTGTRSSVLAPCRDEDLEEIVAIIITTASPSTIHDSTIHV